MKHLLAAASLALLSTAASAQTIHVFTVFTHEASLYVAGHGLGGEANVVANQMALINQAMVNCGLSSVQVQSVGYVAGGTTTQNSLCCSSSEGLWSVSATEDYPAVVGAVSWA